MPIVYVAAFWAATGFTDPRLTIMTVLVAYQNQEVPEGMLDLALAALFVESTILTESITRERYFEYVEYQRSTSMLNPWILRQRRAAAADAATG